MFRQEGLTTFLGLCEVSNQINVLLDVGLFDKTEECKQYNKNIKHGLAWSHKVRTDVVNLKGC